MYMYDSRIQKQYKLYSGSLSIIIRMIQKYINNFSSGKLNTFSCRPEQYSSNDAKRCTVYTGMQFRTSNSSTEFQIDQRCRMSFKCRISLWILCTIVIQLVDVIVGFLIFRNNRILPLAQHKITSDINTYIIMEILSILFTFIKYHTNLNVDIENSFSRKKGWHLNKWIYYYHWYINYIYIGYIYIYQSNYLVFSFKPKMKIQYNLNILSYLFKEQWLESFKSCM